MGNPSFVLVGSQTPCSLETNLENVMWGKLGDKEYNETKTKKTLGLMTLKPKNILVDEN
jgi:hypothetical protein